MLRPDETEKICDENGIKLRVKLSFKKDLIKKMEQLIEESIIIETSKSD